MTMNNSLAIITPEIFNNFGNRQFVYLVGNKDVFNGLKLTNSSLTFRTNCIDILRGKRSSNVIALRLSYMQLLLQNPALVNEELLFVFSINSLILLSIRNFWKRGFQKFTDSW